MQTQHENDLELSPEALAALAEFAKEKGLAVEEDVDGRDLRKKVEESCNIKDNERDETFIYTYGPDLELRLQGWKKDLGQCLDSTGLTMWRAGEDLASYLYEKREALFGRQQQEKDGKEGGRYVLELGCGLGLCGLLASHLNPNGVVVLTDGDAVTMVKLNANVESNEVTNGCAVTTRELLWGKHEDLMEEFADNFDLILAADVIYEEQAIEPLLKSVAALLRDSPIALFLLSFARRNVSIEKVLSSAHDMGFSTKADETFECSATGEYVYVITRKKS